MRILIVGNGVAGQTAAERLRKMDDASNKKVEITLFAEEKYPYYTRIFLPQYLAGMKETEDLIMRDEKWYKEHDIGFLKGHKINKLKPDDHEVVTEQGDNYSYDKLILTTGSNARKIDFGHPDMDGLFTLRSIQDADEIRMYMSKNKVNEIFIVGGGLLGIELAYHLVEAGHQVTVCEIADYLLPRQLDKGSAEMLQDYLESKNINIVCGNKISCVRDYEDHKEIELDGGKIIKSDMILEQVGIIPEISLAESAGLKTEKGIVVDEFMRTSENDVYAAGDCIQFGENIWGIIPASREQAILAADHILGRNPDPYTGTQWFTNLKIAGISVKSYGKPPEENENNHKVFSFVDKDQNVCRKAAMKDEKLIGAVLLGPGSDSFFRKNIGNEVCHTDIKENLSK